MKSIAIVLAGLFAAFLLLGCVGPPLVVAVHGEEVRLDFRTMGEYPSSLRSLKIGDKAAAETVWEIRAQKEYIEAWTITLHLGANLATPPQNINGVADVLVPGGKTSFTLESDREYVVEACSKSGRCTTALFELSSK